ncbi:MAG: UdgX family uracil-DNA binding protein [Alphaproteobacteria bacterium]
MARVSPQTQLPLEIGDYSSLKALRMAAATCKRCPLWKNATQTVFGEGPAHASLVFVGEQPGDKEDIQGHPFVGPAGVVLDKALSEAEIPRSEIYVTNAVKHFKNEPRGKRRLHKRPDPHEIKICSAWLNAEVELIKPRMVIGLGTTAAYALLGSAVTIHASRRKQLTMPLGFNVAITTHPSAILRQPDDESREQAYKQLVEDFVWIRKWAEKLGVAHSR